MNCESDKGGLSTQLDSPMLLGSVTLLVKLSFQILNYYTAMANLRWGPHKSTAQHIKAWPINDMFISFTVLITRKVEQIIP